MNLPQLNRRGQKNPLVNNFPAPSGAGKKICNMDIII